MTEAQSVALGRRPIQRMPPGTATPVPAQLITDDEIRRLYRIAESLALSKMFKDTERAEQAFAKMIIGRDLGMSPAQAMLGLHIVEGSVMVHYAMLGRFVKAREDEGYAYRAGWLKQNPSEEVDGQPQGPTISFVWMDQDDPTDTRPIVGASVTFTVNDQVVGVSTFTTEDAEKAGLIKSSEKAAWNTSRRNMLLARAMSNGVKWHVPEVMGGLPIYVDGEIAPDRSVTSPVGDGDDEGQGLDMGPKVEKIIARATELGHAGLANRAALEIALGNRAPGVIKQWYRDATQELDRFETEQEGGWRCDACGSAVPGENPPAQCRYCDVGPDGSWTGVAPAEEEQEPQDAEVVDDRPLAEQAQEDRTVQNMETQVLQTRLRQLEAARVEEQDPEQRALIDEEVEHVRHQLGEEA